MDAMCARRSVSQSIPMWHRPRTGSKLEPRHDTFFTHFDSALATFASKPLVSLPWFVTPTPVPLRPQSAESYPPLGQCHRAAFPDGKLLISPHPATPPLTPPASRKSPFWERFYPLSAAGEVRWGAGRWGLHPDPTIAADIATPCAMLGRRRHPRLPGS